MYLIAVAFSNGQLVGLSRVELTIIAMVFIYAGMLLEQIIKKR